MADERGYPIPTGILLLLLIGGGWYFLRHYDIEGLDHVSVRAKPTADADSMDFVSYTPNRSDENPFRSSAGADRPTTSGFGSSRTAARPIRGDALGQAGSLIHRTHADLVPSGDSEVLQESASKVPARRYRNLRIASWAMGGFGPSKLANDLVRKNVVRILRRFDVVALQQISATERDLLPRLVDALNEGQHSTDGVPIYDFILSHPSGPTDHQREQLAFLFDTRRVQTDRSQTYLVSDPADRMTHDPVVAWFRAAEPDPRDAWTFSLVNVRIELSQAKQEVALLPNILSSVRKDGRGEDDVVLAGLFQADDAYLIPTVAGTDVQAAVNSLPTDVFARHQTANILVDRASTSEYLGRGGPLNFLRAYNLTLSEAEAVSPTLPVFAEFTATEGGHVR